MRLRRTIKFAAIGVVSFILLAIGWFWYISGQPLYEPGRLNDAGYLRGSLDPPPQPADDERWLVEPDIKLHHWSTGAGRPVLVLHGGPGYPFAATPDGFGLLQKRFEFHFYDQRGCGNSTRPFDRFEDGSFYANMVKLEKTLGIGAQVADIERIRRILQEDKLVLIGHSFGAFLATMYAVEFPDRVRALVLVAPAGVLEIPAEGPDFFATIRSRLPQSDRADYDRFVEGYLDFGRLFERSEQELAVMNRKLGEYFVAASNDDGEPPAAAQIENNGGWMVQAVYLSMGRRHDYRPALKRIQAKTLVLHGASDILPESIARSYAELIPGAKLTVLKSSRTRGTAGQGHAPFSDDPVQFSQIVEEFLSSIDE